MDPKISIFIQKDDLLMSEAWFDPPRAIVTLQGIEGSASTEGCVFISVGALRKSATG
ncbi:MAG: hypothetical protein KDN05_22515 [Verrucomicrobiae bacterium]|nr:hypothetical protein [Verrucomicrobiae bacterium]